MTLTAPARWLAAWAVGTAAACLFVHARFALRAPPQDRPTVIATVWSGGQAVARAVLASPGQPDPTLDAALAAHPGATRVEERVTGRGPIARWPEAAMALSFVPGRDGVVATLDGRTAYLTPDELLAWQAYDKGLSFPGLQLSVGLDVPLALALLGERLGVSARDLVERADLQRVRVERLQDPPPRAPTPDTLDDADVRAGLVAAAHYLARGVGDDGRFRYLVDAPSNRTLSGYDWPRHAGATYFLAQAAEITGEGDLAFAALRAAGHLRDRALQRCGAYRCVGDDGNLGSVDVGSSALALLAFVQVARKLDPGYALLVPDLAAFLRAQQRDDGEFMHFYDRKAARPIDVQTLYYSGEAAFALSRAHSLLGDSRDLDAAIRGLDHLVTKAWSFFGSRYYWGEEHWTCQAMDDLWGRAPAPVLERALTFCLDWAAFGRKLLYAPGDTPFDADGAYGFGPVVTPRLTPAGSRSEAGLATLDAARRAGRSPGELEPLERQLRRSLAMLLRHQFRPGPRHLFADPDAVEGALPGSEVDWALRIDYEQHTGGALVRWLNRSP
jgi:hypothetical protein